MNVNNIRNGVVVGAIVLATAWICSSRAEAQQNQPAGPAATFVGSNDCKRCHREPTEDDKTSGLTKFVWMTESEIWATHDKHSKAYAKLSEPRGQEMQRLLGWQRPVTEDQRCLSCHANWHKNNPQPPPLVLKDGVSCESCHGAASLYTDPHHKSENRFLPAKEKFKQWGLVDVRNPLDRAEQCLSCHIGNAAQGKVLTHEMYAAGHPPLPSIEIETFAEKMPPHFRYLDEKTELTPEDREKAAQAMGFSAVELHRTRAVMAGAMMSLRESTRLLVAEKTLDFAAYDCASCHHDLAAPGWRQTRGYGSKAPGRPRIKTWPTALVEVGVRHASRANKRNEDEQVQELNVQLLQLEAIVSASPFGQPAELPAAVDRFVAWLDARIKEINESSFEGRFAVHALLDIAELGSSSEHYDFDSARQIAWAFGTMYDEFKPRAVKQLGPLEPQIAPLRKQLSDDLHLELPSTSQKEIMAELQAVLARQSAYDPSRFRDTMQQIGRLLPPRPPIAN